MNREQRYEAALNQIITADPEYVGPSDELQADARACDPCRRRRLAKWPPSGLCEAHYREFEKVDRANENRRRYFASVLRDIARKALSEEATE